MGTYLSKTEAMNLKRIFKSLPPFLSIVPSGNDRYNFLCFSAFLGQLIPQTLKYFEKQPNLYPTQLCCSFKFILPVSRVSEAKLLNCNIRVTIKNNYPKCSPKRQRICAIDFDSD